MSEKLTKRDLVNYRVSQLDQERSSYIPHWREIGNFISTRRPRFLIKDINKGDRRNNFILDSTATLAWRDAKAGMTSGLTPSSRNWFEMTTGNPNLRALDNVQQWLFESTMRMREVIQRSNFYNRVPEFYGDSMAFATAAMLVEPNDKKVFHTRVVPIGSYMFSNNPVGKIDTFYREFSMTIKQMVDDFGRTRVDDPTFINWDKFSTSAREAYVNGRWEQRFDVGHIVWPNMDWDPSRSLSKFKRFESLNYEKNTHRGNLDGRVVEPGQKDKFLRESGFDYFPILGSRWERTDDDSYGNSSPGMNALPESKQLQSGEKHSLLAIEKMVKPPMKGPTSLRNEPITLLPGGVTYYDEINSNNSFQPSQSVNFRVDLLESKQEQVRQRIDRSFYRNLFQMLLLDIRRDRTATEILEMKQEQLMALSPVIEQFIHDFLDPFIDIVFFIMFEKGMFSPPPVELEGLPLTIEYVSILAQAQKMISLGSLDRFTATVSNLAQSSPEAGIWDKVNIDKIADEYAAGLSIPPQLTRTDDEVRQIREERKKVVERQQQIDIIKEGSKAAKNLSESKLRDGNALEALI